MWRKAQLADKAPFRSMGLYFLSRRVTTTPPVHAKINGTAPVYAEINETPPADVKSSWAVLVLAVYSLLLLLFTWSLWVLLVLMQNQLSLFSKHGPRTRGAISAAVVFSYPILCSCLRSGFWGFWGFPTFYPIWMISPPISIMCAINIPPIMNWVDVHFAEWLESMGIVLSVDDAKSMVESFFRWKQRFDRSVYDLIMRLRWQRDVVAVAVPAGLQSSSFQAENVCKLNCNSKCFF